MRGGVTVPGVQVPVCVAAIATLGLNPAHLGGLEERVEDHGHRELPLGARAVVVLPVLDDTPEPAVRGDRPRAGAPDHDQPTAGPSTAKGEPIRRFWVIACQRRTVRSLTGSSPSPAQAAHSSAGPRPWRKKRTAVASTEPTVQRPRHGSAGMTERVGSWQKRALRIGSCSKTSRSTTP